MGQYTLIAWCMHTFNVWIGCAKVSPGCAHCYAEADMDKRRRRAKWGPNGTRSATSNDYWRQPYKWNREAQQARERRRVFCSSLADVFEDWEGQLVDHQGRPVWWSPFGSWTPTESPGFTVPLTQTILLSCLWKVILDTPWLDWLLLTKRPENVMGCLRKVYEWRREHVLIDGCLAAWIDGSHPPDNVWLGTSVESQQYADERIPLLCQVPARLRFLSCEPLLGPVTLNLDGIGWVILGGESSQGGKKARPFDLTWARSVRDQCQAARVPFFLKQLGSQPFDSGQMARVPGATKKVSIDEAKSPEGLAVLDRRLRASVVRLKDHHGGKPEEWPQDLRVREVPHMGGTSGGADHA